MSQFSTDEKGVTRKDGKIHDTIPTYTWGKYVGGKLDGEDIVGRDLEKYEVTHGAEEGLTYSRRRYVFGPIRVIAYVDVDIPKAAFWPYDVLRAMALTHHDLKATDFEKAVGLTRDGKKES